VSLQAETAGNDKIIYQYKLLKKIRRRPAASLLHSGALLLWLSAAFLWRSDPGVVLLAIAALALWHGVAWTVTQALIARESEDPTHMRSRYAWQLAAWPRVGYLPSASVPYRQFRSVQLHLLFVGLVISGMLSAWLTPESAATVAIVHVWWMAPRLHLVYALRRSATSGSIITFTSSDVGLHAP